LTARDQAIAFQLANTPWADWRVDWLAGDASTRRYARLTSPIAETAILMDMGAAPPPDAYAPFLAIAAHLRDAGLCAPATLLNRASEGVLVIQDLGSETISSWLGVHPHEEEPVYTAAVTLLARLATLPLPPGLTALNPTRAAGMIAPIFDHYATGLDARSRAAIIGALQSALAAHAPRPTTLALRDFMPRT
jgi:N-acetylmuramate 1-kinase